MFARAGRELERPVTRPPRSCHAFVRVSDTGRVAAAHVPREQGDSRRLALAGLIVEAEVKVVVQLWGPDDAGPQR